MMSSPLYHLAAHSCNVAMHLCVHVFDRCVQSCTLSRAHLAELISRGFKAAVCAVVFRCYVLPIFGLIA